MKPVSSGREGSPDPVADFYERHPYPPPKDDLDGDLARWGDPDRRRAEYHLIYPDRPFRGDLDVLVAGCGTFQAARHAIRWSAGRVVGVDVSERSARHTQELAERHGLGNLEVHQMRIEDVARLDREFDLVICTGVLHHLEDPDAGLRALAGVLRRGGAMQLMVYATYGRTGVRMMQEYARRLGVGRSRGEVLDLANTLAEIPWAHPLVPQLQQSADFRQTSGIADALLNPRERTYTVPELLAYVERNGLAFGRWYRQAPYLATCGAPAATPHAARLAALPPPEQSAAMELFRGAMTTHSLVVHRSDEEPDPWRYGLDDEMSDRVVPIRVPHAVAVVERLPAGAAAVLVNRAHQFEDIVMPVSDAEKRVVDAIDGHRTVGAITADAGLGPSGAAALFQRLYQYDQVAFAPA
jgi:SAM-dependent methyltransferase